MTQLPGPADQVGGTDEVYHGGHLKDTRNLASGTAVTPIRGCTRKSSEIQ